MAASMLTLTYYGAESGCHITTSWASPRRRSRPACVISRPIRPEANRVNAISAGPIKTLAASGIGDFRYILKWNEYNSPLAPHGDHRGGRRYAVYLLSPTWRAASPAKLLHVDAGYHVVGMKNPDAPDISVAKD